MAIVILDSPDINQEFPFAEGAQLLIPVQARLAGNVTPQDWTLRATSLDQTGATMIDDKAMGLNAGVFSVYLNAGPLPTGKPNSKNLLIRVKATKNTGGAGIVEAECMAWIESSSSSDSCDGSESSDNSETVKPKVKAKAPILVAKARASLVKSQLKPAAMAATKKTTPAKKQAPAKKPAAPAKKSKKK